ncbi:hypothetical protein XI08_23480 [Bradyrhizobium sp. CCBAU 11361]|nr:hypothetical protein [Bradyrhizobium sp. CCBAU 11361]
MEHKVQQAFAGAGRGRARRANAKCSRFVLIGLPFLFAVNFAVGLSLEIQTATCQVPSASRNSAPAAKLQQPEDRT